LQDAIVNTVVSLSSLFLIEQSVQAFYINFGTVTGNELVRHFQKYTAGIYFNLYPLKNGFITIYINQDLNLPHIQAIHQLQNVYYEPTGAILKQPPLSIR
jgi:hypothetical protein